jgi:predicted NAD/FAD-binding protein
MQKEKLAIIGTGISGMGVAYFLRDQYDITLYEKNDYIGGHTNTVTIVDDGKELSIDTAFMVYNETTYPLLTRLFEELEVKTKTTSMSFSVQHVPSGLEFSGTGYNGLFSQRRNVLNQPFIRMLLEIERFNKEAQEVLVDPVYQDYSLADYVTKKGYSANFVEKFLIPMSSAVWSTPADTMLKFPVVTLVQFFRNHCFLGIKDHLQWRTCEGGSRQYRDKLLAQVKANVWPNRGAKKVLRQNGKVTVIDTMGLEMVYDKVVMATHADDTLTILDNPTADEKQLLGKFPYTTNSTILHTDERVMPRTKRAWSSWNYRISRNTEGQLVTTTIYDMTNLQGVLTSKRWFISLNDPGLVDPKKVVWKIDYRHPLFLTESLQAQHLLPRLNESGPVYFCGAYFRYGFHEDGLLSALNVARKLSKEAIWP